MWAKSGLLFTARVVFLDQISETDPTFCFDASDLRRLLLHRLEVLEAALLQLAELQSKAVPSTTGMSYESRFRDDRDFGLHLSGLRGKIFAETRI